MTTLIDVNNALTSLKMARFAVVYETGLHGLYLPPFKGSTFRGAFGQVFREMACTCHRNESGDINEHFIDCPYAYIFETSPPEGSDIISNYESIPRPFILEPPDHIKTFYPPGERFILFFTLFGNAIEYLPYFINVFDAMGQKGFGKGRNPANLRQIFNVDAKRDWQGPTYESSNRIIDNDYKILIGDQIISPQTIAFFYKQFGLKNTLTIHFTSPTRMKHDKRLVSVPEFHIIMRNTVRRITSLLYFHHGEVRVDMDFSAFFEEARKIKLVKSEVEWIDWERYSSKQNERLKMGGIIGKAVYKGDIAPYIPWLLLGEWTSIGKNPVFGLGRIKLGI
jgi:hypothetical protein